MKIPKSLILDLYTDYLIAGVGQTTATGFSLVLNNQITHDMVTRLLSSGFISSQRLWSMVKPMCEEIEDENGVLIIDDSIEAKPYTDCNDLICWHFDHTVNRSVKGVNFVSAIYDNWKMSLPIGVCFVEKDVVILIKRAKQREKAALVSKSISEH